MGNPPAFNLTINNGSKYLLLLGPGKEGSYSRIQAVQENGDILSPDREEAHSQAIIDRAAGENLMVFWSAPANREFQYSILTEFIKVKMNPYTDSMLLTKNYAGFGLTSYGFDTVSAGGVYDRLLSEYTAGRREKPVWIIGESDFGRAGYLGQKIDVFTVVEAGSRDPGEIMLALRRGKCYAVHAGRCGNSLCLEKFVVGRKPGIASVKLSVSGPAGGEILLELVRDGEVVRECRKESKITLEKDFSTGNKRGYFRIIARDACGGFLASNPLFYPPAPVR